MLQIVCPFGTCWEMLLSSCPHDTSKPRAERHALRRHLNFEIFRFVWGKGAEPFLYWLIEVALLHFKSLKASFHHPAFNFLLLLSVLSYFPVSPRCSLNTEFSFLPFYFHSRWWRVTWIWHLEKLPWLVFFLSFHFILGLYVLIFLLIKQLHLMPRGFQCSARSFSSRRIPFVTLW